MTAAPRVRRLPVRSVLVELPASPDAVESDPTSLPTPGRVAAWRRWGWAVALVPTVALIVYQRLAAGRDWAVPEAVVVAATVGLAVTALLALVRYQDDRGAATVERGRRALLDAPVRATGTFTPTGSDKDPAAGLLTVTPASGDSLSRPVRVVVPEGVSGPRAGDPLAVWHAAADEDATGVLLVRYHREWADDLLAALRPPEERAPDA
ncbi:hypothetical protein V5D56_11165 [Cellulosimicrobium sp. PMB13]|uniref:hypothetical protein n=1 Tax=Cellulosimicrobium sp. PMB13 TaxID=3120158 RepID=UPI003F4BE927